MMPPRDDKFEADLVRVAKIAEVDPLEVLGFTLVVEFTDGRATVITNACCYVHALERVSEITGPSGLSMVPCSDEL